jgi:hypothetical protein
MYIYNNKSRPMKKHFKKLSFIFTFLFIALVTSTFAQDPGSGPDPGGDPDVPIDGGIALLAAGAAAYGIKTLRNKKEKS